MKKHKKEMQKLLKAKQTRRKRLARLPIEEKIRILVDMQTMAVPIYKARGLSRQPWKIFFKSEKVRT